MVNKTRYKAKIADQTYTIIGSESKAHMDAVVTLVNNQLEKIMSISEETTAEQGSILLAINALSDQVHMQEKINELEEKNEELEIAALELDELREAQTKMEELESRLSRYEGFEKKAKEALKDSGQTFNELSLSELQDIINKHALNKIQQENNG